MNQTINMKKQLLKQALCRTSTNKRNSTSKNVKQVSQQSRFSSQLKKLQTTQSVNIAPKLIISNKFVKKQTINQSIVGNILIELQTSRSSNTIQKSKAQSCESSFTQKPSTRSAFSQLLYTQQTDNVKEMIHKLFQRRNFINQLESEINSYAISNKKKQQFQEMKIKLLNNQIFVLSLQTRIKEKNQKEKQQILQKQVKKKVIHHFQFAQNQRQCHAVQNRIQKFLQEKLRKIRRKEF